jgi:hypothetical protein
VIRRLAVAAGAIVGLSAQSAFAQDLQPPPAMSYAPPPQNASTDESQDSGLGLEWVYLNADAGFAYTNMQSLSASNLAIERASSAGGAFGVAAGARLLFFTVGVRARDLQLSAFNLWELDAEAALHMRVWHIDPYFGARGGYVTVGGLSAAETNASSGAAASTSATSNENVHGFNVGPMFGIDIYFSSLFTIGAEVNAEFLILERPPIPVPASVTAAMQATGTALTPQQQQLYNQSGSSVGFGVVGSAQLGLHF